MTLTKAEKLILSEALAHYAHAAAYFNGKLLQETLELRKKINESD